MVSRSSSLRCLSLLFWGFGALACSDEQSQIGRGQLQRANVEAVTQVVEQGIGNANSGVITEFVADDYRQHSTYIADGRVGFLQEVEDTGPREVEIHRILADGPYVALHLTYGQGANRTVGVEVFRLEVGILVEHWDASQSWVDPSMSVNGRSMVDGPSEIVERAATEANRSLATEFVEVVFTQGNYDRLDTYLGDSYLQHNPLATDGVAGIEGFLSALEAEGNTVGLVRSPLILAEGNFVLVGSEGFLGPDESAYAIFYDLWRVQEEQLVEHWDVIPRLPTDLSTLPHANGLL